MYPSLLLRRLVMGMLAAGIAGLSIYRIQRVARI